MVRDVLTDVLLGVACIAAVLGSVGVAVMHDALDRLHFTGAFVLAFVGVAAAIVVREGFSLIADKALLIAGLAVVSSPVAVQVIARAIWVSQHGDLDPDGRDVESLP